MDSRQCAVCGIKSKLCCSRCRLVYYCGRDHQSQHWCTHRTSCPPFKVQQNDSLCQYMVASCNVTAGQLLLREAPLLKGPSLSARRFCLGCYKFLPCTNVPCVRCGWPMCSARCADLPDHVPECSITTNVRREKVWISNFEWEHPLYRCVTVLRALFLREADPVRWHKLLSLNSHCQQRRHTPRYEEERISIAQFLRRYFKLTTFSEDDIMRILGILQVNGYVSLVTEPHFMFMCVYECGSFFENSCHANCSTTINILGDLVVYAAKPIAHGEHLSICYTDPLLPTIVRQLHLLNSKFFLCRCSRCVDLTEMGTYFSAMRCPKLGCDGLCVPNHNWFELEPWRCQCCRQLFPAPERQLQLEAGKEFLAVDLKDMDQCMEYLHRQEMATAHLSPNHSYLMKARLSLAVWLGYTGGISELAEDSLLMKEELCLRMLQLTRTLCPADKRRQGTLLIALGTTLLEIARRHTAAGQINSEAYHQKIKEGRKRMLEGIDALRYEIEADEADIAQPAREKLQNMDDMSLIRFSEKYFTWWVSCAREL